MRGAVDGSFVQDPLQRRVSEFNSSGALIASHLVEVISRDPVWEASWIPARWATRLDPVRSLKAE